MAKKYNIHAILARMLYFEVEFSGFFESITYA